MRVKKVFCLALATVLAVFTYNLVLAQVKTDAVTIKSLDFFPAYSRSDIFSYEKSSGKLILKNNTNESINNLKYIIETRKKDESNWFNVAEGVVGLGRRKERGFDFDYVFSGGGTYIIRVRLESASIKEEKIPNEKGMVVHKNVNIVPIGFDFVPNEKNAQLLAPVDGEIKLTLVNHGKEASGEFKYRILVDGNQVGEDRVVDNLEPDKKQTFNVGYKFEANQGGWHTLAAMIDPDEVLKELRKDESNVIKEMNVGYYDIAINEFKLLLPTETVDLIKNEGAFEVTKGTIATLRLKVKNQGNMLIKNLNGEISICGAIIKFSLKNILPEGGTKTYEFSHKFITSGSCDIVVYLDKNNELFESDKKNNKLSVKTNIQVK